MVKQTTAPSTQNEEILPVTIRSGNTGCLDALVLSIGYLVVVMVSFFRQVAVLFSTIETNNIPRQTALIGVMIQFFLIGILLLPFALFWPGHRRRIFRSWLIANSLILFTAPLYLLDYTAYQIQAFLLILFFILVWIGLLLIQLKQGQGRKNAKFSQADVEEIKNGSNPHQYSLIAWLCVMLLALLAWMPWLVLGAFGSPLDTLLSILLALCFGLAASLMMDIFILETNGTPIRFSWSEFFIRGVACSGLLALLTGALSFSFGGIQLLLLLIAPGLGWILALLSFSHYDENTKSSVPKRTQDLLRSSLLPGILIGVVLAAPLVMIDPDELLLVLAASPGEILATAFRAAALTILVILGALLIGLVGARITNSSKQAQGQAVQRPLLWKMGLLLLNLIILAIAVALFTASGQPGFNGERLFVILEPQADLYALINNNGENSDRREIVYQALIRHANETQENLRASLDRVGIDYTPYYLINALEVNGGPLIKAWLEAQPEVERVLNSSQLRPLPNPLPVHSGAGEKPEGLLWNQALIHADRVWNELNIQGEGIVIGQSDSGVQGDHPELAGSYRGASGQHDYNWFDPWNNSLFPVDIMGHGTHTLATILGRDTGIASKAQWIGCVNQARNLGNPALYLDCMQFMLAPFPLGGDPFLSGDPQLGANIMNNSWGCPELEGCDANVFLTAVRALQAAGVFFVASAGNDGPTCGSLNDPPPIYEEAFAVGAIDRNGDLAFFSSIGPVTSDNSNRVKPDLVAPGVSILSALPNNTYGENSGTSMAGPHVAGVVALMWSANPSLVGQVELTRDILIRSAQPYQGPIPQCPGAEEFPSTATGYGILDAYQAVKLAFEAKLP